MRVRYRVDGRLYKSLEVPVHLLPAVTSRIKIMASLDISERRLPQDGRIPRDVGPSQDRSSRQHLPRPAAGKKRCSACWIHKRFP